MYLHELGDEAASFTKEDMQQGFVYLLILLFFSAISESIDAL